MAQPTPYERQFAFSGQPKATWAEGLENELNAVKVTSDETLANLELIQRDDGALRNGIVTRDSLAPDLALAGLVALDFADEATSIAGEADNVAIAPLGVKQQIDARLADQATAEAGTDNSALMTPLRTKQQADARLASQPEAEAGLNNTKTMTPLRSKQSVIANAKDGTRTQSGTGSVARTIDQKLDDLLNVKDKGAVADGVTDDKLAFQAAASLTSAHIKASPGDYYLSGPVYSNPGVGYELDTGVVFTGTGGPGGGAWLPDVISNLGTGPGNAVKTLAKYATNPYDDSVLLIGQTQGYVAGAGPGLPGQQQAVLIRQITANSNDATRGLVGIEIQQEFGPSENVGAMWGYHALNKINLGQTPYLCLAELQVINNSGHVQPEVGFSDSTLGVHINNLGDTVSTTAISFGDAGSGAGWRYGTTYIPGAIRAFAHALLDNNHDVVAGMDTAGKVNAQKFAIGTVDSSTTTGQDGSIVTTGAAVFAESDGSGGVALGCTEFSIAGSRVDGAWQAYAPTVGAASGTITTSSATGAWKLIGKTVHFRATLDISNNGSGAGAVYLGLPTACKEWTALAGNEQFNGYALTGFVQPGQSAMVLKTFGGGYPATGGGPYKIIVSGSYEAP